MSSSAYDKTSGSNMREGHPVMDRLLVFSLDDEIQQLREETPWEEGDRNSRTLAKDVDFRVLLTVLRDGATLEEADGDARVSIHLLEGRANLTLAGDEAELEAGELAAIDAGHPWSLRATGDCALVLTLAWPREKAVSER